MLAVSLGADAALADKKVVVQSFSGPRGARVRRDVAKALRGPVNVIPPNRYDRAARKLRARSNRDRDVSRVARQIGADGILSGQVRRRGGRYQLSLRLRAGRDGDTVERVTINLGRAPRLTRRAERQLRNELVPAIDDLPPLGRGRNQGRDRGRDRDDDDDDVVEEEIIDTEGVEITDDEDIEEQIADDDVARRDQEDPIDGGDSERDRGEDDGNDGAAPMGDRYARLARNRAIDLAAGLSFTVRSFSFDLVGDLAQEQIPNGYDGTAVPGAFVDLELYPLLVASDKADPALLDGIGVTAVVDYVVSISSQLENDAMNVEIPTSQLRWGVGAVFRYNFGDGPTGPTVKLAAAYNKLTFELDKEAAAAAGITDISLPNVDYTYFDAGADLRYPVTRAGTVFAGGRLLVLQEVGEIADLYGSADVSGFDVEAGYEHRLGTRLLVRGGARYQSIAFTFTTDGPQSDRNGDGMSDVAGAEDTYLAGYLTAGYLF